MVNSLNRTGDPADLDRNRMMESLRRAVAHDVRTPLGTIVNYAAILEAPEAPSAQEVRNLARKIRGSAMRAAGMLQQISGAIAVLANRHEISDVEVAPLLRACLDDTSRGRAPQLVASGGLGSMRCPAQVCSFLWRTLFLLDRELRGEASTHVEYEASEEDANYQLMVWLGGRPSELPAERDWTKLMREESERVSSDTRMALELALAIVRACGGRCSIHGQPGFQCAFRLCLPAARAA